MITQLAPAELANSGQSDTDLMIAKSIAESFACKLYQYQDENCRFVAAELNSRIFGKALISLPYFNHAALEIPDRHNADKDPSKDTGSAINSLIECLDKIRITEKFKYIEIRCEQAVSKFEDQLQKKVHKVKFIKALDDSLNLSSLNKKVRSQIRKAQKNGCQTKIYQGAAISETILKTFHRIYRRRMHELGSPAAGYGFFESLRTNLGDKVVISIGTSAGKQDCAASFSIIRLTDTIEILWAATPQKFLHTSVNMLIYWDLMKWSARQGGLSRFDFGRCSKDSGSYRFKEQWGATVAQMHWYYLSDRELPEVSDSNLKLKLASRIWQKLPAPLVNRLGPAIFAQIPA